MDIEKYYETLVARERNEVDETDAYIKDLEKNHEGQVNDMPFVISHLGCLKMMEMDMARYKVGSGCASSTHLKNSMTSVIY